MSAADMYADGHCFKPQRGKFTPAATALQAGLATRFKPQRGKFTPQFPLRFETLQNCFKPQRGKFTLYFVIFRAVLYLAFQTPTG